MLITYLGLPVTTHPPLVPTSSLQPTDDMVPDSPRTAMNDNFIEKAFLAAEALPVEVTERTVNHRQRPSPSRSTVVTTEDGAVQPEHTAATAALPSSALSRLEKLNGELLIDMQAREQDLECAALRQAGLEAEVIGLQSRMHELKRSENINSHLGSRPTSPDGKT
jgi:hypothetical protein